MYWDHAKQWFFTFNEQIQMNPISPETQSIWLRWSNSASWFSERAFSLQSSAAKHMLNAETKKTMSHVTKVQRSAVVLKNI